MSKIKNQGYTDSSQVLGGASFFALGERGGRQKGTGGQKTSAVASLSEVNPQYLSDRGLPRTSVLMNTFPAFFFHHKIANRL